mmetsp:Transcript_50425/g.94192  ORF Transcript_50425/g.94192 Transcript_50425/m.94192 type:complete len:218 (-) Transcript_50425:637-1290(-)
MSLISTSREKAAVKVASVWPARTPLSLSTSCLSSCRTVLRLRSSFAARSRWRKSVSRMRCSHSTSPVRSEAYLVERSSPARRALFDGGSISASAVPLSALRRKLATGRHLHKNHVGLRPSSIRCSQPGNRSARASDTLALNSSTNLASRPGAASVMCSLHSSSCNKECRECGRNAQTYSMEKRDRIRFSSLFVTSNCSEMPTMQSRTLKSCAMLKRL